MPTRYLKPGVRDSDTIDGLSPMAEVLFYRLLVTVDDFGRFDARPSMIKSQCFPIKDAVTAARCVALMAELADAGLIELYQFAGKSYLQMCKWDNAPRSKVSKFPSVYDEDIQVNADVCNPPTVLPVTVTVTETETETPALRAFVLPDWIPKETWQAYCKVRTGKKAKNEPHALGLIVKDLETFRSDGHDPVEVLNNSIKSGWAGVFAPKASPFAKPAPNLTVAVNPDVNRTRQMLDADKAIVRTGPSLEVLAQMAKLRGVAA